MKQVFETVKLGDLSLKNRLIRSATWEGIALPDGGITEEAYEIYEELARGGVGAIITGFTSVAANDFYFEGMMRLSDNRLIPQYRNLMDIIHRENCPVIAQLALGAYYRSMENGRFAQVEPDGMTVDEIETVIEQFGRAARRAREAGFDGVQIGKAHGLVGKDPFQSGKVPVAKGVGLDDWRQRGTVGVFRRPPAVEYFCVEVHGVT